MALIARESRRLPRLVTVRHQVSQRHEFEPAEDGDARRGPRVRAGRRRAPDDVLRRRPPRGREPDDAVPPLPGPRDAAVGADDARVRAARRGGAGGRRRRGDAAASGRSRWSTLAARRLHADPLFARLLDVDPELLLPYVTRAAGRDAADGGRRPGGRARPARRRLGPRGRPRGARARRRADGARVRARARARTRRLGRARPAPSTGTCGHERRVARTPRAAPPSSSALAAARPVDVVVVGGGITGAGVALDAAWRGLSVALLERRDLAHGTSRWSSKLVHGGLRYLEHGDWALAWESAIERSRLMRAIAPHLVRPLPFLIPLHPGVGRGVGGEDADRPAGRRRAADRRPHEPPACCRRRAGSARSRRAGSRPRWPRRGLRGALLSWDGQLEDDARLVVAVARTAAAHGARILTYAGVTRLREDGVDAVDGADRRAVLRARAARDRSPRACGAASWRPASRCGRAAARTCSCRPGGSATRAPRSTCRCRASGRWVFALPRADGLVAIGLTDVAGRRPDPRRAAAERGGGGASCSRTRARRWRSSSGRRTSPAATPACARCSRGAGDADRRPLAPPRGAERPGDGRADAGRRQAHDLPADGAGRRRPRSPTGRAARAGCRWSARRARAAAPRRRGSRAATAPRRPPSPRRLARAGRARRARCARPSCAGRSSTSSRSRRRTSSTAAPAPGSCPEWREAALAAAHATIRGWSSARSPKSTSPTSTELIEDPRGPPPHAHPGAAAGGLRAALAHPLRGGPRRTATCEGFAIDDDDGAFLGLALAPAIDVDAAEAELGYIVAAHARGRGVATEALRQLTKWAFERDPRPSAPTS